MDVALEDISPSFPTPSEVLKAANYMMAVQIARKLIVWHGVRESSYERARIDVVPTNQGLKEIDSNRTLPMKFFKDEPVPDWLTTS